VINWAGRAILLAAACGLAMPAQSLAAGQRVVVLATEFVLEGKLREVAASARQQGLEIDYFIAGRSDPDQAGAMLERANLVVLDAPRLNDGPVLMQGFDEQLAAYRGPRLSLIGGIAAGLGGLSQPDAEVLADYYLNGTTINYDGFFRYWLGRVVGDGSVAIPSPVRFPQEGIYHPDYPGLVAAGPEEYEAWLLERGFPDRNQGTVGLIMGQGLFPSDQLAFYDEVIRRIEAAGARPWAFYFGGGPAARITTMASTSRGASVDVLINMTHLRGTEERIEDLVALDVALLQGFVYRDGGIDRWRADNAGIPMQAVPAFLTVPEQMGALDAVVVGAAEGGVPVIIEEQLDTLVSRAVRIGRLRWQPESERTVALLYWSYPPGERGVSASHLNVPRSLERLTIELVARGYATSPLVATELEQVLPSLLDPWQGRLSTEHWARLGSNRDELPMASYLRWYEGLPLVVRDQIRSAWGEPETDPMVIRGSEGELVFVIPMLRQGSLAILPQPSRRTGATGLASYHDAGSPPSHAYLATYFYLREILKADVLVHFGTHGTQEFLPGKERGLSVHDFAALALGDLPVVYPYVTDNIAEALQARRRGQAVTVSHQPPPFVPAGLHGELQQVHDLMHEWDQLDTGPVRLEVERALIRHVAESDLYRDLGWSAGDIPGDFPAFAHDLHIYLHELARDAQPVGLHVFGVPPAPDMRITTLMQMLGEPFYERLGLEDTAELFVDDYTRLKEMPPFLFLARFLKEGADPESEQDVELREMIQQALRWDAALQSSSETSSLLAALEGRYVMTSPGGDPLRNPEVLPSGRNLYGFDPARVPTERAWVVGKAMAEELLALHLEQHGDYPRSLAMSLWSSETMRQNGILEAQMIHLLGLQPVWDRAGRLMRLEVIPGHELDRPRVDVVASVTGVYRDQFGIFMTRLSAALVELSALDESGNPIAEHSQELAARLISSGTEAASAMSLASIRFFSSDNGNYGTEIPDALLDTEGWVLDEELAAGYLDRMQYAYGSGPDQWGGRLTDENLYAENLRRVEGAVLSRSSNLHGLLSTDHPFEYLGGIAMAVRSLTGRTPDLYINDLRNPTGGRQVGAARYLAGELRSRYQHPGWISGMQAEGYAGTLELLNIVNNFFGWQVTDPSVNADVILTRFALGSPK
jgi:cobaltochelatase CobN